MIPYLIIFLVVAILYFYKNEHKVSLLPHKLLALLVCFSGLRDMIGGYRGGRAFSKTSQEQYKALLLSYCGSTTSLFVAREAYATIKLDESFPLLEDYPFLLNATKLGNFVYYLNKETVMFRQRKQSVYAGDNDRLFKDYYKKSQKFDRIYRYPNLPRIVKYYEITNFYRLTILDALHFNKKTFVDKLFYDLTKYLNPFRYLISLDDFLYKFKK